MSYVNLGCVSSLILECCLEYDINFEVASLCLWNMNLIFLPFKAKSYFMTLMYLVQKINLMHKTGFSLEGVWPSANIRTSIHHDT